MTGRSDSKICGYSTPVFSAAAQQHSPPRRASLPASISLQQDGIIRVDAGAILCHQPSLDSGMQREYPSYPAVNAATSPRHLETCHESTNTLTAKEIPKSHNLFNHQSLDDSSKPPIPSGPASAHLLVPFSQYTQDRGDASGFAVASNERGFQPTGPSGTRFQYPEPEQRPSRRPLACTPHPFFHSSFATEQLRKEINSTDIHFGHRRTDFESSDKARFRAHSAAQFHDSAANASSFSECPPLQTHSKAVHTGAAIHSEQLPQMMTYGPLVAKSSHPALHPINQQSSSRSLATISTPNTMSAPFSESSHMPLTDPMTQRSQSTKAFSSFDCHARISSNIRSGHNSEFFLTDRPSHAMMRSYPTNELHLARKLNPNGFQTDRSMCRVPDNSCASESSSELNLGSKRPSRGFSETPFFADKRARFDNSNAMLPPAGSLLPSTTPALAPIKSLLSACPPRHPDFSTEHEQMLQTRGPCTNSSIQHGNPFHDSSHIMKLGPVNGHAGNMNGKCSFVVSHKPLFCNGKVRRPLCSMWRYLQRNEVNSNRPFKISLLRKSSWEYC